MHGSRALPLDPGERAAGDTTLVPALFTWNPNAWDQAAGVFAEFEARDASGAGLTGTLAFYVHATDQLVASYQFGLPADTSWHRFARALGGLALVPGTTYRAEWNGNTNLKQRNLVLRAYVSVPGSPAMLNAGVGQSVGDGRTLSLWPLFPVRVYREGDAGEPRMPASLPTKDRAWVSMSGAAGTYSATTWTELDAATLWEYRPNDWGGAVAFQLEVVAAGDYGGSTYSRWLVALHYAATGELVPGSVVEVDGNTAALRSSGSFQLRGNEAVVAKVVRIGSAAAALSVTSVRLAVTSTGGAATPILRTCAVEPLAHADLDATGTTWEDALDEARPMVAGSVDWTTHVEATMARTGSAGNAEVRLVNRQTATTLATLTESGATATLQRSADLRSAMEADGVVRDSPESLAYWRAGVDVRGDAAGVVGELRALHLATVTRHDPVSNTASVAGGWALDLPDQDEDAAAAWSLAAVFDADLPAAWSVQAGRNLNRTAAWAVATTPDQDAAAAWLLDLEMDEDLAAAWALDFTASASLPAAWRVARPRNLSGPAAWRVQFQADADLAAAWVMLRRVDLAAAWNVRLVDRDVDRGGAWAALQELDADQAAAWAVTGTRNRNVAAAWRVNSAPATGRQLPATWTLAAASAADVDLAAAWSTAGRRDAGVPAAWRVAVPKNLSPAAAWKLAFQADQDVAGAWDISSDTDVDLAAAWQLFVAGKDAQLPAAWAVFVERDVDLAGAWVLFAERSADLPAAWATLPSAFDVDVPALWTIIGGPDVDLAAAWLVVAPAALREDVDSLVVLEVSVASPIVLQETLDSEVDPDVEVEL